LFVLKKDEEWVYEYGEDLIFSLKKQICEVPEVRELNLS
jgi:hypothetical protein